MVWPPEAWDTTGEAGDDQRIPGLIPIIDEIVNHDDWASGQSLVIIITGSGKRVAESFDGDSDAAALLHVECLAP